ncbi:MAG: hypothetical protein DMG33_14785 [Acidobacteria bacterium]|nr:MAG: hypothetical protein DMG33_14785 [Acidobacteriota bacterium]
MRAAARARSSTPVGPFQNLLAGLAVDLLVVMRAQAVMVGSLITRVTIPFFIRILQEKLMAVMLGSTWKKWPLRSM